jgi:hypothetical protein
LGKTVGGTVSGMSVAGKGTYLSRFFVKLMEIMLAAIATAVSGYLVAHLSGYLPPQLNGLLPSQTRGPVPAVVETAPNQSTASKTSPVQPVPAAVDAGEQHAAPQQDGGASAAKKSAKAAPARKSAKSEASTIENKPREGADNKPREADDKESVEARVRAALANVDANRPAPPRPAEVPAANAASASPPRAADLGPQSAPQPSPQAALQPPSGQTAPIPPAAVQAPVQAPLQAAPVQPAPAQPDPLTSVEIKSRPVATVDEAAPSPEQPAPPPEERGLLSAIKHILPDFRRPTPTGEAPRPPAPVGDDSR